MPTLESQIRAFLSAPSFAVVGASDDPRKYGHRCYLCYLQNNMKAYPVNPNTTTVLGSPAFPNLSALPEPVESISVITPPPVTDIIVDEAIAVGVKNIWLQPGAESWPAVERARQHRLNVIAGGPCLLVTLGYHGH